MHTFMHIYHHHHHHVMPLARISRTLSRNLSISFIASGRFSGLHKSATVVEGDDKVPFSIATTSRCREGRYTFPRIAPLYP